MSNFNNRIYEGSMHHEILIDYFYFLYICILLFAKTQIIAYLL